MGVRDRLPGRCRRLLGRRARRHHGRRGWGRRRGVPRAIIDWSADRYGTSPDRAVVAGISNGAFMAHRMGIDAGDQVAVIAAVAGGLPASLLDRTPSHAVSAMLIHGTADSISPIEGGYSRHRGPNGELRGRTLSLDETAEFWRRTDRCPPGPASSTVPSSPAGTPRQVGWAEPKSPPGRCSMAATPGLVPHPPPSGPNRPLRSSTRPKRSAGSRNHCSYRRPPGGCNPGSLPGIVPNVPLSTAGGCRPGDCWSASTSWPGCVLGSARPAPETARCCSSRGHPASGRPRWCARPVRRPSRPG